MKGYTQKILHVDLSRGSFEVEEPPESFYRKYAGGACMGAYYVTKLVPPKVDPLSPDNVLVFAISAVVGAPIHGNARHCVTAKSPLTGTIASSEGGGYWGPELKFAGFDAVVIRGKAAKPVYLWIHEGRYELRDAAGLWGRTTGDVQDAIRAELADERIRVAQCGPAGEKSVLFAAITNELKHFNGRNGLGAVMGSKNLRALAVRGTAKPELHDLETIQRLARVGAAKVRDPGFFQDFKKYGTTLNVTWNTDIGGLPTKNWTMGTWDKADAISAETYQETMMDSSGTCWACAQACKRDVKSGIEKPWTIESRYGGPEYETIGMVGSNCLVSDLNAIAKANELASKYCMDTISLGGVIGFVMECFEKGVLTTRDTEGLELRFGDGEALVKAVEMIGKREGFGDQMAEGLARLAEKLGPKAQEFAVTVKGKEFPAHMPTAKGLMALIYALNPFGPDHVSSDHDGSLSGEPNETMKGLGLYEGSVAPYELNFLKAQHLAYTQRAISAIDSWSVCQFTFNNWSMYGFTELLQTINACTGWDYTMHEFLQLGARRINLMKAFNAREGFGAKDDILPERLYRDPMQDEGPRAGQVVDREKFLRAREDYYRLNGWDPVSGNPLPATLQELGLGWVL